MNGSLSESLDAAAFAFRGYNVTNLGRSRELLDHPRFGAVTAEYLSRAAVVCREVVGRPVDLIARIRRGEETTLETYDEAIAITLAMEMAQLELLRKFFGVEYSGAAMAYGYSLGEIAALAAGGVLAWEDALRIPLSMAADCAALAHDAQMGVVFSRAEIDQPAIHRQCLEINTAGQGVIGISSILAPNSLLVIGQQDTVERLDQRLQAEHGRRVHVRRNPHRWPPLHTPLVWQKNVSNRAGVMMHTIPGGFTAPAPPVFSLVTCDFSYTADNARDILVQWIDRPQRLWDAVCETCSAPIDVVVHVGPEPNLIPATFQRLASNVADQTQSKRLSLAHMGRRAIGQIASRPWLRALLPSKAALFRAPQIEHVILEDWLLSQPG